MARIELQLDPETLERVRSMAQQRGCTLEALLKEQLDHLKGNATPHRSPSKSAEDPFWGLFSDMPGLMDQIVEEAMKSRHLWRLRETDV